MYPGRWFPVSGYTTDRFAADMHVTVPAGYTVLGTGIDTRQTAGDKECFQFQVRASVVPRQHRGGEGAAGQGAVRRRHHTLYFRGPEAAMAQAYGEKIGQMMSYFTGISAFRPTPI
jgi:hypothetical protein